MDVYLIVLRVVHIVAGVFWVGSAFFFFFFFEPTVNTLGPAAGPVMGELTQRRKMPMYITAAAGLTVLAGILLYVRNVVVFDLDWITSPSGLTFTIGGVAAILAFVAGIVLVAPRVKRMGAIGAEVQGSGGPPSAELMAELQGIQRQLRTIGRNDTILLVIAVLTMAIGRYV